MGTGDSLPANPGQKQMDWFEEMRARHSHGYIPSGMCLACRHGWHSAADNAEGTDTASPPPECTGRRFGNACPDYADPTPTVEEYKKVYARELRGIFEGKAEFHRVAAYGNAKRRREFLTGYLGVAEKELREIEDEVKEFKTDEGQRLLRKLRWEL